RRAAGGGDLLQRAVREERDPPPVGGEDGGMAAVRAGERVRVERIERAHVEYAASRRRLARGPCERPAVGGDGDRLRVAIECPPGRGAQLESRDRQFGWRPPAARVPRPGG